MLYTQHSNISFWVKACPIELNSSLSSHWSHSQTTQWIWNMPWLSMCSSHYQVFQKELVIKCEQEDQAFVKAEMSSHCCLYMIQPVNSVSNCLAIHNYSTKWTWCSCISVVPHALVHSVQYATCLTCLVTSQYSALTVIMCYVYASVSGAPRSIYLVVVLCVFVCVCVQLSSADFSMSNKTKH